MVDSVVDDPNDSEEEGSTSDDTSDDDDEMIQEAMRDYINERRCRNDEFHAKMSEMQFLVKKAITKSVGN
jgi:hypothetical protein